MRRHCTQPRILIANREGKDVFVAPFNSLACFSWTDSLSISLKYGLYTYPSSFVPRPLPTREKGLVHTDCACARLSVKFP